MRSYLKDEPRRASPWVLDSNKETEQVVIGAYFATAITAIATGNKEKLKPREKSRSRVLYYDDKALNPSIEFTHTDAGIEAFVKDQEKYWKSKNVPLPKEPRECQVSATSKGDQGPKSPEQFPHIYESPIKTFGRNRDLRPFSRVIRNLDKPNVPALQAALIKREPTVNPLSYKMPDLWKSSSSSSIQESSVFKSKTKRMEDDEALKGSASESFIRRSLERERGRNLGRSASPPLQMLASLDRLQPTSQMDDLQLGERGMQSLVEDYFLPSSQVGDGSSHVFNHVDPKIRNEVMSKGRSPRHLASLSNDRGDVYGGLISPKRSAPSSPTHREQSRSPERPVSPSQDAIAFSRQRGFTFTTNTKPNKEFKDTAFKVFVRDQLEDGSRIIRPVSLSEYMEREENHKKDVEAQIHQQPVPIPRSASPSNSRKREKIYSRSQAKPLSFGASSSYEMLPSRSQTSHQSLASRQDAMRNRQHAPPRNAASAPVKLGITSSNYLDSSTRKGISLKESSALRMDDSLFGDDDDYVDQLGEDDEGDKKEGTKSYHSVILSRWAPPMCYSKKKAQDQFLFQRSHGSPEPLSLAENPPGSAPQLDSFFSKKPKLKNPGKSFEETDFYIAKQGRRKRPTTTSALPS